MRGLHDFRVLDGISVDIVYSIEILATSIQDECVECAESMSVNQSPEAALIVLTSHLLHARSSNYHQSRVPFAS